MTKRILTGVALAALCGLPAMAAPARVQPMTWLIAPDDAACRADLELTGRAGPPAPVWFISDGERLVLRFHKADGVPERAFLPIRVDQKPYSNLMQRTDDPKVGELVLSEETLQALRRGRTLQIAWLADEVVGAPLAGSEQAILDLRICGAQAAGQARVRAAAAQAERERTDAETHAKALADAQLQAARAQAEAAEAERQRQIAAAEAERQRLVDAEEAQARADAAIQQRAYLDAQRQRAYEDAQRRQAYEDETDDGGYYRPTPQFWPPRPVYGYRRPY